MEPIVRIWEIDSLKYIHRRFIISLVTAEMQSLLSRFSCLSHGLVLLTLWGPQSFRLFSRHQLDSVSLLIAYNKFLFRIRIGNMHVSIVSKQVYVQNNYSFLDNFIIIWLVRLNLCVGDIFINIYLIVINVFLI